MNIFSSKIEGISKEIDDIIEDIQDEARANVLARQLEYTVAEFDFTLLAARTNTLVQSILISQDSNDFALYADWQLKVQEVVLIM